MTRLNARDNGNFHLPEGMVLNVKGAAGSAGIVRRVDPAYGGMNYVEDFLVSDIKSINIGPYSDKQTFFITCTEGNIDAVTSDAAISLSRQSVALTPRVTRSNIMEEQVYGTVQSQPQTAMRTLTRLGMQ